MASHDEHTLEFLLAFDGRIHYLRAGYWLKFEIKRVGKTPERPYGISYSVTLHAPNGARLVGFDNAHRAGSSTRAAGKSRKAYDHWHRRHGDAGRPYVFVDAATLLEDFFDAVERQLEDLGLDATVISVEQRKGS